VFVLATRKAGIKSPAEIDAEIKKAKPLFDKRDKALAIESSKWQREIEMLERRVETEYVDLELPGGDTIAIRTCLSNPESDLLGRLREEQKAFDMKTGDPARLEEIMYEILELVTANPLLTVQWFRENEGKYATMDALAIAIGYHEKRIEHLKEQDRRVMRAYSFREDEGGASLRGVPSPHENH
jgi:hypothetical protein